MFLGSRRLRFARLAVIGAAALMAAACGASSGAPPGGSAAAKAAGGTATVALPADTTLNYIFPFVATANESTYNSEWFQELMYRPLYMFGNNGISPNINYPLSPANAPVYSDGGKTVTLTMKGWKWSDGETVDARDVVFWLNMMRAEKINYYGYVPGLLPDNLVSYSATGPDQVTMHMNRPYSSIWFTYNQLAEITPMPMAWDVTKAGAAPGSGGCSTDSAADKWAKCVAVWTYLTNQAKEASSYATSPVWAVDDGPWHLSSYSTAGNVTLVPNPKYSGSPRPTIAAVAFVPYTSDAASYTALRTGSVDVGDVPSADLPQKPLNQGLPSSNPLGSSYYLEPFYQDSIEYYQPNLNNPTMGPVFKQLYVRQALQELVDQKGLITAIWRGYAYPTSGAVPNQPASQWIPSSQKLNGGQGVYPFSIAGAKALLTSHGWSEVGGVMTCEDPARCGAGISKGQRLAFSLYYSTGTSEFQDEAADYKSDAAQAGVDVSIVGQSFDTVIGESTPCSPGPKCNWDALMYGGWIFNGPGYEPTGEPLFQTGAASNSGSYSNQEENSLIVATHTSNSVATFQQYANYTNQQAPYIWMPAYYYVEAVSSKLHNVTFNPLYTFLPEYWYFTK